MKPQFNYLTLKTRKTIFNTFPIIYTCIYHIEIFLFILSSVFFYCNCRIFVIHTYIYCQIQIVIKRNYVNPVLSKIILVVAQFLGETGRLKESSAMYRQAIQKSPNDFELVFNAANILR